MEVLAVIAFIIAIVRNALGALKDGRELFKKKKDNKPPKAEERDD